MSDTIKAAVAQAPNSTTIQSVATPKINDDDGLLKVEVTGVCGTDVSNYEKIKKPMILGHHVVGTIEQIGEKASKQWGVVPGDRVAMEEYIPCGQCRYCRVGKYRSCPDTDPRIGGIRYGATPILENEALYGGFSQYMYLHPNAVLHPMPKGVPDVEAALTLPIANGFEWMSFIGNVGPGQTVVIQGPGQQGLACVIAAKACGADNVIITGRTTSAHRLEAAKEVGADLAINIMEEDVVETVKEYTNGNMADLVIDVTSGGIEPVVTSMQLARRGGQVLLGAYKYKNLDQFPVDELIKKTLRIEGVRGHSFQSVRMAIDFISSKQMPLSILTSHQYDLENVDLALRTASGKGEPSPLLVSVIPS